MGSLLTVRRRGFAADPFYAERAGEAVADAVEAFHEGRIGSLDDLLALLAERRREIAFAMGDPLAESFGATRADDPDRDPMCTPLDGEKYGYIHERFPYPFGRFSAATDDALVTLTAWAPVMIQHTVPSNIAPILAHCRTIFERIVRGCESLESTVRLVGILHWWLAHAMPYRRGSAAITDMATKVLFALRGIALWPWREGVLPDLEALATEDVEGFGDRYASLFEAPPAAA